MGRDTSGPYRRRRGAGSLIVDGPIKSPKKIVISQKSLFLNNPLRPAISWSLVESLRVVVFYLFIVGL